MSRMWLKNGRAVLTDGRAVLCDECPCGCRYTYYVDHSLATSGDGHSWETAFNSVNNVFDSVEIYNYRRIDNGCKIYVKIKGLVNYLITGAYITNALPGQVVLQSENSESRVTAEFTGFRIIASEAYNIAFENWDFSLNIPAGMTSNIFNMRGNTEYFGCSFLVHIDLTSNVAARLLYTTLGNLTIRDCTASVYFVNSSSGMSTNQIEFRLASNGGSLYLTRILNFNSIIYLPDLFGMRRASITGCAVTGNSILENCDISYSWSQATENTYYYWFYSFEISGVFVDDVVIDSCTGSFTMNVPSSTQYLNCRFYMPNGGSPTFYNCEQYCHVTGDVLTCLRCGDLS